MQAAHPYLIFDGNARQAFEFYRSVFGGDFPVAVRFKDMGGGPPGASSADLERIAHISLPLGGANMLMASDVLSSQGQDFKAGNNFYVTLNPDTSQEADRVFNALSAGGRVEMPLQRTAWAEKHGQCTDRFGVQWMVTYAGSVRFQGGQGGR